MDHPSTSGGSAGFPQTPWTTFAGVAKPAESRKAALTVLANLYWRPVCCYIRARSICTEEDAKDLTQDFFLWVIQNELLLRVDRERGRFRAFVKVALDHYLTDDRRRRGCMKRGGHHLKVRLECEPVDTSPSSVDLPEEVLERSWKAQILSRATEVLERFYAANGHEVYFKVFRDYFLFGPRSSYRDLAERYGITTNDVSNYLMHAKRRLRETLEDLVAETVRSPEGLQEEMRALFGAATT